MSQPSLVQFTGDDAAVESVVRAAGGSSVDEAHVVDELVYAGAAIAAGDWVVFDTSVTDPALRGAKPSTTGGNEMARGVAMAAIPINTWGRIRRSGPATAKVAAATAAEVLLRTSTTAATADGGAAGVDHLVGVTMTAESGGLATVDVRCL